MVTIFFEKFTLSNGLDVILHQDRSLPVVAVNVWYHVGSKDEEPGRTGFAHLFEHLMFEGSKNHNRSHFEPLQKVGAALNGSTNTDRTNYWENVPSNYLELALWLEADRMGFLLDALDQPRLDIQRDVVKNERRQSYENRPYGMASFHLQATLYPRPHPYHWWTIGDPADLDAATLEDAKAFFRRFYGPSNASLAIAGDFKRDEALALVHRYFDDLPPLPPLPRLNRRDSDLQGRVSLTLYDKVQLPRLYLAWPTQPRFDPADAPLTILADILASGKSSRLYRSLVYEKRVAQSVIAFHGPSELAGEFTIEVTAAPGSTLEELLEITETELEKMRREPPTAQEIARAKNTITTSSVRQLERVGGFGGRADRLNSYNVLAGDPGRINTSLDRYLAVEAIHVQQAAATFLGGRRVQLEVLPEPARASSTSGLDRSTMPGAGRPPSFTPPVPQSHTLPNGLRVMVVERRELPLVAFGLMVGAGSITDIAHQPGLAYLTSLMLDEGTTTRSSQQIADEFEDMGSHLSASTGREHVLLSAETLKEHWPKALELVADIIQRPTFPEEELERVRREHMTNLQRIKDEPTAVAERVVRMLLYGPSAPYGHPVTGTEEAVEALTRANLVGHFQRRYGPAGATLAVVGDVSQEEAVFWAERHFGEWKASLARDGESPALTHDASLGATTVFLADKPGAVQSVIRAGKVGVPRSHPDYYALTLLNYAFGGQFSARLNMNLRQAKGYSYGYRSFIEWHRRSSALMVGGSVHTAVTKESVVETLREIADVRGPRPISLEEFEAAKAGILRGFPSSFETLAQVLDHLTDLALFDLPEAYFATAFAQVEALTLEQVRQAARDHLDDQHLTVLVVGDQKVVEAPLRELGLLLVVVDYEGRKVG
ncbi:MAG: insulinase family protein [Dehalococcoidia bacterium]|nr:insulinase family protein [Dehalococcoidia bacterium]